MTLHLAILRAAALLLPRLKRAEWLAEWQSELWYVRSAGRRKATVFCLGAFPDALWLTRNSALMDARRVFQLESPLRCMMLLAVLAVTSFLSTRHMTGGIRIFPHLLMILIALVVLPAVTSLDFGEYPSNNRPLSWPVRRWMFFAAKIVLLVVTVLFGALILVSVGAAPILGQAVLVGYVLAFRWSIIDQRQRCPVCLRVLTNPVRIGQFSRTLLAPYGTELVCAKGHGVLHAPEIRTSFYTQCWRSAHPREAVSSPEEDTP